MIMIKKLKDIKIGLQRDIKDINCPVESVNFADVLEQIKTSQNLKGITEAIRAAKDKNERSRLKAKLPAVIISANTVCRKASDDDERTGLIFIDLDGADNEGIDLVAKVQAMHYPWLIGYMISPSGDGVKVLCGIQPELSTHLRSFMALDRVFTDYGLNVDQSCKDAKRVTYVPHDPNVDQTLTQPLEAWDGERIEPIEEVKKKAYTMPRSTGKDSGLSADDEAGLCLEHLDPDMEYQEWIMVGMALKDHGVSCAVWEAWSRSGQSFKDGECERKWGGFNGSGVGFGTVVQMAKDNNGNRNPISARVNARQPVNVGVDDFDEVDDNDDNDGDDANNDPIKAFHHNGKFYVPDGDSKRFIAITQTDFARDLRALGYSNQGANGQLSAVDVIKHAIIKHKTVDHVGSIAGRSIGLTDCRGVSHLVTRKNQRVEPVSGEWTTIERILVGMFGEQLPYLYSWLHRGRKQLINQEYLQGHILAVAGKPGGGKSLFAEVIATPLFGQSAKAARYLMGDTDFNADLIGSELLLLDDDGGERTAVARAKFGSNLKAIAAGSKSVSCHGKGNDAYNVNPLWRCIVCLNDDEQAMGAFPPLGEGDCDSIGDKVLLLKCASDVPLPFAGEALQSVMLEEAIESELAAFAAYIDGYQTPSELMQGTCRFGFDEFHHRELVDTLNHDSNERTLLSETDRYFFRSEYPPNGVFEHAGTGRRYWSGTAIEWSDALLRSDDMPRKVRGTVEGELAFGGSKVKAGQKLRAVADISDGRIQRKENGKKISWTIWDDIDFPEGDPF